jgi:hypothetical protein
MRNLLSNRFGWMQPAYCEAADPAQQPSVLRMSKETIEAQRRRRDGSGPTGRAEAPQRQRPGSTPQTSRPTSTGGGIFGSGSSSSGGGGSLQLPANLNIPKLPWWMWLIILVGGAIFIFFILPNMGSLDQTGTNQTDYTNNTDIIEPTLTLVPFVAPTPVTGKGQTWTVMLYMDADDQVLEEDILIDLNEVEKVGSTDRVRIVAQLDRFKGGFSGDGDWTGARRYYITQDDDLRSIWRMAIRWWISSPGAPRISPQTIMFSSSPITVWAGLAVGLTLPPTVQAEITQPSPSVWAICCIWMNWMRPSAQPVLKRV